MKPKNFSRAAFAVLASAALALGGIRVEITGNHFFGGWKIKDALPTDPEKFDGDGLNGWKDDAVFNVTDLYRQNGFFDAHVDLDMTQGSGPKDWKCRLTLDEGKRYLFDTVCIVIVRDSAAPPGGDSTTLPVDSVCADTMNAKPAGKTPLALVVKPGELNAEAGKPYQENDLFKDRRRLIRNYGDAGFVHVKVDDKVAVKPDSKTVKVSYSVDPFLPVIYDTTFIHNRRAPPDDSLPGITRHGLLRSLVPYRKGDTVRISPNAPLIEKLQSTGVFDFVRIKDSLMPGPEHGSAFLLEGEEHVPGHLRSSLFWDSQYGAGVSFDADYDNVAGTLNQLRSEVSLSTDRQRLYGGITLPLLFGSIIRFNNDLDVNWYQAPPVPNSQGLFGGDFTATNSARLSWPWSYWLRLISDAETGAESQMMGVGRTRALDLNFIQTATISFVDQPMDPTRGLRYAFIWGNGGPLVEDGDLALTRLRHNWFEVQSSDYYYYPPLRQIKFAVRLSGGRFFGEGGTNSERFFLGGSRSVRSYGFQSLCPEVDTAGFCSTDHLEAAYFLTSYELRIVLFDFGFINPRTFLKALIPLEVVPFYDFGKVWNVEDGFSFSTQTHGQGKAYGIGLRYPLLGIFNFRLIWPTARPVTATGPMRGSSIWPRRFSDIEPVAEWEFAPRISGKCSGYPPSGTDCILKDVPASRRYERSNYDCSHPLRTHSGLDRRGSQFWSCPGC